MDIQFYETFLMVAQTLSFRVASQNLEIVQSTVSSRVQALEDFHECILFSRKNKKVQLTNAGKTLLPYARRIVQLQNEALKQTRHIKNFENELRIGAEKSIYLNGVAEKLNMLSKETETRIILSFYQSNELLKKLIDNQLDIAYTYNCPQNDSIYSIPYRRDNLILVSKKINFEDPNSTELFDKNADNIFIKKEDVLKLDMIYVPYSQGASHWISQLFPKDYGWPLELDPNADVISHVVSQNKAAFVLNSHYNAHPMKALVDVITIQNMSMPYFQSYALMKNSNKSVLHLKLAE